MTDAVKPSDATMTRERLNLLEKIIRRGGPFDEARVVREYGSEWLEDLLATAQQGVDDRELLDRPAALTLHGEPVNLTWRAVIAFDAARSSAPPGDAAPQADTPRGCWCWCVCTIAEPDEQSECNNCGRLVRRVNQTCVHMGDAAKEGRE